MRLSKLFSCLVYGSFAFGPAVSAAIIDNGSFESPALAEGVAASLTPTGWQWVGSAGFVINPASGSIPAFDGAQLVDIGNTSAFALRQDFSIAVGGRYDLTWHDNAVPFFQEAPYTVAIGSALPAARYDANEGIDGTWNRRTLRFDLAAGIHSLVFAPADIAGPLPAQDRFIDQVSLVSSVPLPAAAGLFGVAIAGLGLTGLQRTPSRGSIPQARSWGRARGSVYLSGADCAVEAQREANCPSNFA